MTRLDESQYVRVPVGELRTGMLLRSPIYSDSVASAVLLIAAGKQFTPAQLRKIEQRGVTHVLVGRGDLARTNAAAARRARFKEAQEERERLESERTPWSNGKQPFLRLATKSASNPHCSRMAAEFGDDLRRSTQGIGDVYRDLIDGHEVSGETIIAMTRDCLRQINEDVDLFVALGMAPDISLFPVSHCIQVARLAMSAGAIIGMDEDSLIQLGTGCLLHDVGMLLIDPDLLSCERQLDPIERLELHKHPISTVDMIEHIDGLSLGARMVAYQMHERLDGSGYPRGRMAISIHPFAKLAMVADAFVTRTSPRPHRPALTPYQAMLDLLAQVNSGHFDRNCVTALLDTVSMFPLGSLVELSDGRRGTVVRAHPGAYTRPIVEVAAGDSVEIVDLLQRTELTIANAIDAL